MRRSDRLIESAQEIDEIIRGCEVCRLALAHGDEPYLVPVSFGYDGEALFFHTARAGQKIDFIEANCRVCFEMERGVEVLRDPDEACKWTMAYESVIGRGTVTELISAEDKSHGLNQIMLHYSGTEWAFDPAVTERTRVWRISIDSMTGKRSGEKDL